MPEQFGEPIEHAGLRYEIKKKCRGAYTPHSPPDGFGFCLLDLQLTLRLLHPDVMAQGCDLAAELAAQRSQVALRDRMQCSLRQRGEASLDPLGGCAGQARQFRARLLARLADAVDDRRCVA